MGNRNGDQELHMSNTKEQTVRVLVNAPEYLFGWTWGLILTVLSDTTITTLAVTGALVGLLLDSILIGFVAFFVLYSLARLTIALANAIGSGLTNIAQVLAVVLRQEDA